MRLGHVSGERILRVGQDYWLPTPYSAVLIQESLAVFEEVVLLRRCVEKTERVAACCAIPRKRVRLFTLPDYRGAAAFLQVGIPSLLKAWQAVREADVWVLSAPNLESFWVWFWCMIYSVPYALELRGDQSETLRYLELRGVRFPLFVATFFRTMLWLQRSRPIAILSVSSRLLSKYRRKRPCPAWVISDARIPREAYRSSRRGLCQLSHVTIISIGRCEAQKNPIGLIRACACLKRLGWPSWRLIWVGDGPLESAAMKAADDLSISDRVACVGHVPWGEQLFGYLDKADVFVLSSLSEGLPRALVEAMARGLPAVATNVGGVAELLPAEDMVPPENDDLLAAKLSEVLSDPGRLRRMSERNLRVAGAFAEHKLRARKQEFYKTLRKLLGTNAKRRGRSVHGRGRSWSVACQP